MIIHRATLHAAALSLLAHFYGEILALPVEITPNTVSIRVGMSTLVYRHASEFSDTYHVAFEIPRNLVNEAQNWLARRVPLLADQDGVTRFEPSATWNTTNLYFNDPAGNILELIARHDRPTDQSGPFAAHHLLNISEIGLVVPNVPTAVAQLSQLYGLHPFNGQSATFTPVGDHDGMLIVVPTGRGWFPVQQPAVSAPLSIDFSQGTELRTVTFRHDDRDATSVPVG
ncbi:hypothetical protein [Deinococcus ruber]|uniref:VOC domain-containing protein n=1 Tax=Deinococcus ruber TaxID=1848197 RepID=A0A918FB15_9DEIO|nr:hypothetical protein [Deinococcus ruber]GGR26531.1 hypothetical protein GCM10008957_42600 [Deinococcus ruber]